MKTGVYKISNLITGDFYIGSSAASIRQRWAGHVSALRSGKARNKYFQNAWNKYGCDAFKFEVLEPCKPEKCIEREQYWIDTLKPTYNLSPTAGSTLGFKLSVETKQQMSKMRKGIPKSPEHAQKIGAAHLGMKRPEEARMNMRVPKKTKKLPGRGRKQTEATKQKIREKAIQRFNEKTQQAAA